mmetsp:Transcript_63355/g.105503  ORF Transcript_63355/g.105503 Transcript_63355/m.105503 type:complete len:356 (-) Transcript_63355:2834-3901(-)
MVCCPPPTLLLQGTQPLPSHCRRVPVGVGQGHCRKTAPSTPLLCHGTARGPHARARTGPHPTPEQPLHPLRRPQRLVGQHWPDAGPAVRFGGHGPHKRPPVARGARGRRLSDQTEAEERRDQEHHRRGPRRRFGGHRRRWRRGRRRDVQRRHTGRSGGAGLWGCGGRGRGGRCGAPLLQTAVRPRPGRRAVAEEAGAPGVCAAHAAVVARVGGAPDADAAAGAGPPRAAGAVGPAVDHCARGVVLAGAGVAGVVGVARRPAVAGSAVAALGAAPVDVALGAVQTRIGGAGGGRLAPLPHKPRRAGAVGLAVDRRAGASVLARVRCAGVRPGLAPGPSPARGALAGGGVVAAAAGP